MGTVNRRGRGGKIQILWFWPGDLLYLPYLPCLQIPKANRYGYILSHASQSGSSSTAARADTATTPTQKTLMSSVESSLEWTLVISWSFSSNWACLACHNMFCWILFYNTVLFSRFCRILTCLSKIVNSKCGITTTLLLAMILY